MAQHHKIEELLSPDELEELRKFVRERNGTRTTDEVHEWMLARGYTIGRTACGNWLQKFREQLIGERFSRSGELAKAIASAVSTGNFDEIAAAANKQLVNVVFEQAARLEADGELDAEQVESMTRSLKNLAGTQGQLIELRVKQAEAIRAAEAKVRTGASAGDVVATIKKALGIAA